MKSDFHVDRDLIFQAETVMKNFAAREGNTFKPSVYQGKIACIMF